MRKKGWAALFLALASCSAGGGNSATLVLKNPYWRRVNVEAVITTHENCDSRAKGYLKTLRFVMKKGQTRTILAPDDEIICWRHDSNPNRPSPGAWSGWSRAILEPGQKAKTDL